MGTLSHAPGGGDMHPVLPPAGWLLRSSNFTNQSWIVVNSSTVTAGKGRAVFSRVGARIQIFRTGSQDGRALCPLAA
jgi:hypothetical protein